MEKKIKLEDLVKREPFKAPDGYFVSLTSDIMANLPDRVKEPVKSLTVWEKIQPWVYMAAMFAGIYLMVQIFITNPEQNRQDIVRSYASEGLNLTSSTDIDDFYRYYEDGLAKMVYDETFYDTAYTGE